MEATVASVLTSGLTSFANQGVAIIADIFPLAMLVVVPLALLSLGFRWFRGWASM